MKDKEMIEEMANDLEEEFVLCGTLSNCGTKRCSRCFSKYLYEQNYRKIPKDSVMLSKEEYTQLLKSNINDVSEYITDELKQASKETAEKYSEMVEKFILELFNTARITGCQRDLLLKRNKKLAKQFSVNIKE